ncbi:TerC family protein [Ascidiimonas sp. W6]|uniref:TerC family protein n=1 Tax=Ascidiimonas meishanensis TaxID=3128903 RepID=UPI0030EDFA26
MTVWIIFIATIIVFLLIDLGIFNKEAHVISVKEASIWTSVWVSLALLFSIMVYVIYSKEWIQNPEALTPSNAAVKYITGYLVELSLSVDNIFVIAVIFSSFKIPQKFQHRVLFWGILGAIIFRATMIFFGVALVNSISWIIYIFGAFLLFTAFKMLVSNEEEEFDPKTSFVYRNIRKIFPVTNVVESQDFFVKRKYLTAATPLFITLIIIEITDVLFALDSIPAVIGITTDPFLVFSSNILAIMGLRSMYFFLANMLQKFEALKYSLVVILSFVGIKLILSHHIEFPEWVSLVVIFISLTAGIAYSYLKKDPPKA